MKYNRPLTEYEHKVETAKQQRFLDEAHINCFGQTLEKAEEIIRQDPDRFKDYLHHEQIARIIGNQ